MGASLSSFKRVNSIINIPRYIRGPTKSSSSDESSSHRNLSTILRVPSLRYLKRRRGSVSAESGKIHTDKRPSIPKSQTICDKILELIEGIPFFQELDEKQQQLLIDAMCERSVKAGDIIIQEGQEGDYFYAVERGIFEASKKGEAKFVYEGSGSFGELALLYNAPRAATIKAVTDGILWALDRSTFRSLVIEAWQERRLKYDARLRLVPLFKTLTDEQRAAIADCLSSETFKQGQVIITQGEPINSNSKFYIVEDGSIECYRKKRGERAQLTRIVVPGDVFGEVALLTKCPRQADCIAASPVVKASITNTAFFLMMIFNIFKQISSIAVLDIASRCF